MQPQQTPPGAERQVEAAAQRLNHSVLATTALTNASFVQVKWMTCLMFFVFAMTTDAVGVIIPQVVAQFSLSLTEAAAFHYVPMLFIGLSGLFLGRLADRLGRKPVILAGLALYSIACVAFAFGDNFSFYLILLGLCGLSIGLFKTGALALIGDVSPDCDSHTRLMNRVEGFFGLGAIVGPALVALLLAASLAWTQLYLLAGFICLLLLLLAWRLDYPPYVAQQQSSIWQSLQLMKDGYALSFSLAIACYVATEVAIFVWLPTLLQQYAGQWTLLASHAITVKSVCMDAVTGVVRQRHFALFCVEYVVWRQLGLVADATFRFVYVDDVPNAEFQGHQLFSTPTARCCGRTDPGFYRTRRCSRAFVDGLSWRLVW